MKDPFKALLEARRRLVPDGIWFGLGLVVVGISVAAGRSDLLASVLGLFVAAAGIALVAISVRKRNIR